MESKQVSFQRNFYARLIVKRIHRLTVEFVNRLSNVYSSHEVLFVRGFTPLQPIPGGFSAEEISAHSGGKGKPFPADLRALPLFRNADCVVLKFLETEQNQLWIFTEEHLTLGFNERCTSNRIKWIKEKRGQLRTDGTKVPGIESSFTIIAADAGKI